MDEDDNEFTAWADGLDFADRVNEDPTLLAQTLDCLFPRDICEEVLRIISRTDIGAEVADALHQFWIDNDDEIDNSASATKEV